MVSKVVNYFKRQKRVLGEDIIATEDIVTYCPITGEQNIIPMGTLFKDNGVPSPSQDKKFIELKLVKPIKKGCFVTDRIIVRRNSKSIDNFN